MKSEALAKPLEATGSLLDRYVETRKILSKERKEWSQAKMLLVDRIALVEAELESFRDRLAENQATVADTSKLRSRLEQEQTELRAATAAYDGGIAKFESLAKRLLARCPAPVQADLAVLSQLLPDDPSQSEKSLGQRFGTVIGILSQLDKLNQEVRVTSEVRKLSDENAVEVTAIYCGLGQGYYVNAKGTIAGYGTAGPDGWVWIPANDRAPQIAAAIQILKNEKEASFVELPVRIQGEVR